MADTTRPLKRADTPYEASHKTERDFAGTAATYHSGQMLSLNAAGDLVNAGDTAATRFAGFYEHPSGGSLVVPTGSAAGDFKGKVRRPRYAILAHAGLTKANVGQAACVLDNQSVTLAGTATNDVVVGTINKVLSATEVEVELWPIGALAAVAPAAAREDVAAAKKEAKAEHRAEPAGARGR